jgi:hypothetical protein
LENNLSSSKTLKKRKTTTIAQLGQSHTTTAIMRHTTGTIDRYIRNIRAMNKGTAYQYYLRLSNFQEFVISIYKYDTIDNIITKTKEGLEDPYDILSGYVNYLQTSYNISVSTLKTRVSFHDRTGS